MFRRSRTFRLSHSSNKSVATDTTKTSSHSSSDLNLRGTDEIPRFVEHPVEDYESSDDDMDTLELLEDLQHTIEDLQNRVTSQIFVAQKMSTEALELYNARMKMGSDKSASYSLRKFSVSKMRLDQCKSIREQLSESFEIVDREMHRARAVRRHSCSAQTRPQSDLYKIYMDLQDMEERIDAAAPSATRCNAKMVQQIGEMMIQEETLRGDSSNHQDLTL